MSRSLALTFRSLILAVVSAVAACGGGGGDGVFGAAGCSETLPPTGSAGSLATHGQPQRTDGPVTVSQDGQGFVAHQLVSIQNDFGGATSATVQFSTENGNVGHCAGGSGGYGVQVSLQAHGATEQEARDNLATMQVQHGDALSGTSLNVSTQVVFNSSSVTIVGTGVNNSNRSASIIAASPAAPSYALKHSTTNGNAEAEGFSGSSATVDTTNGIVALNGSWDSASVSTTSGLVAVAGDYGSLSANSSNGDVQVGLQTRRSTNASISTTNGNVEVGLSVSGNPGFDLSASTTNGDAEINVAGTQPVGSQTRTSKHRQSPDYSTDPVKIQVGGSSTNGDVWIHG